MDSQTEKIMQNGRVSKTSNTVSGNSSMNYDTTVQPEVA